MYNFSMKLFLFILTLFAAPAFAADDLSLLPSAPSSEGKLCVNNRILAKVNGKTISVLDLMKKMDVYLSQNQPTLLDSAEGRYHFYSSNWRALLEQMIDHELILADSAEKDFKTSDSEIREQMMERFGPNIMSNLDKLGMTYAEAREMVTSDIIVQKMTWYRVNNKAIQRVNPQDVKLAYRDYCEQNPPVEDWKYQVLSLRAETSELGEAISQKAYSLLKDQGIGLSSIAEMLVAEHPNVSITLSQDLNVDSKGISASHKEVLANLSPLSYSAPVSQVSRVDGGTVFRIFFLKDYKYTPTLPFEQVSERIQDQLIQYSVSQETGSYINRIRNHFGFDAEQTEQMIPRDFEPFTLR